MTLAENFWESLTPDGDCLIWTHAKDGGGYGKVSVGARLVKAHRYAYELAKGTIPEGLDIDHLCRVRACCNPDHTARRYALVVTSHRGDLYLPGSVENWKRMLPWDRFVQRLVVDDNGGAPEGSDYAVARSPNRRGLAESVNAAWSLVRHSDPTHVFHLEEDFHLTEPLDLDAMADVLDEYGNLAQLTLKRQPWNPQEAAAGGIVEANPDAYVQVDEPHVWTQHRECFSLNPSLIPARVIRGGWPVGNEAEQTARLVADGAVFGFWGGKYDPPKCVHVGAQGGMGSPGWAA